MAMPTLREDVLYGLLCSTTVRPTAPPPDTYSDKKGALRWHQRLDTGKVAVYNAPDDEERHSGISQHDTFGRHLNHDTEFSRA